MDTELRNKISYTNFFLSLLIIWHHTYNVNVYQLNNGLFYNFQLIILNVCEIAVPFFFFLSAFLFYYNLEDSNLQKKLLARIKSLVIPYLIWNLIGYLYFQIISVFPFISNNYGGEIESFSIFGMMIQMIKGDYNLVTWFLRVLIIYTFTFSIFHKIFRKKWSSWIILICLYLINVLRLNLDFVNCACFYYLGIHLALNYKSIVFNKYHVFTRIICLIMLSSSVLIFTFNEIYYYSLSGRILYTIMLLSLWVVLDFLRTDKKPKWWMAQNLFYYCGHEMVLEPIEKIFFILLGSNMFGAVIDYFFAPVITVILIVFASSIIRKFDFIYNLLTGYR